MVIILDYFGKCGRRLSIMFLPLFMNTRKFPRAINTTWVALIQKIRQPLTRDEYKPISMVETFYEII